VETTGTRTTNERVAPSGDVLVQRLPDDESVLLDLGRERYYGLDAVGTRFWEALVATTTLEEAHARLQAEFAVEPERLRTDLRAYVAALTDRGLVRPAP
jgi:hypothetical protein